MNIVIDENIDPQLLYLAIYTDLAYYNQMLIDDDNMESNRMTQHKDQMSKPMVMNLPNKK
jgi:hypothetical protein